MKLKRTPIVRTLALLYLVIFAALALYDAPLQPDVAAFLTIPPSAVTDSENGYFALLGFSAPSGADIHSFGRTLFKTTLEKAAKLRAQGVQSVSRQNIGNPLTFKGKELPKEKFYQFAVTSPDLLNRMESDNRELLARYQTLTRYRRINEPLTKGHFQDVPIPEFVSIRSSQSLWLILALRQAQQGHVDEALNRLGDDLAYWRSTVRQSHMLITKLIAMASIQRDYQALSELVGHASLSGTQRTHVGTMLPEWQAEDTQLNEAFRYEALSMSDVLFSLLPHQGPLDRLLLKKNATLEVFARLHMANAEQATLSADRFYQVMLASADQQRDGARFGLNVLYNPVGAILTAIALPQYGNYCARRHELEAKRRMVLIHLMAREKNIEPEGMETFLKQLGKGYMNPYTNQPMKWDARKKSIYMDPIPGKNKAEQRRIELAL